MFFFLSLGLLLVGLALLLCARRAQGAGARRALCLLGAALAAAGLVLLFLLRTGRIVLPLGA